VGLTQRSHSVSSLTPPLFYPKTDAHPTRVTVGSGRGGEEATRFFIANPSLVCRTRVHGDACAMSCHPRALACAWVVLTTVSQRMPLHAPNAA
jgi:hypothetical protein